MAASTPTRNAAASLAFIACLVLTSNAFAPTTFVIQSHRTQLTRHSSPIFANDNGVIDLTDEDDEPAVTTTSTTANQPNQAAPFLSQGELSTDPNLLNPDFTDPKQTRVIIYIILTLVPILFLIPLMIGSRDLIPLDALPPVELN